MTMSQDTATPIQNRRKYTDHPSISGAEKKRPRKLGSHGDGSADDDVAMGNVSTEGITHPRVDECVDG